MKHGLGWPEECPDGFNCKRPGYTFECEPGTFATDDHLECQDCLVGFKCQKGLKTECNNGTLANSTGQERFTRGNNVIITSL